jgi:hypothetical protein
MGGQESFEVEHFRPRNKFPQLDCVYSNLYYACRKCNAHKSDTWPSDELMARGMQFADPCVGDPYVQDLKEEADGSVKGITPSGAYTTAHIRLHREDVNRWRRLRAQARKDIPVFTVLIGSLEQLRLVALDPGRGEIDAQIEALNRYIADARNRFVID